MSKNKMVRTVRTKVYKFEALNEDAQQKAIDELRDINVDYEWWEWVYEDFRLLCETVGIDVDIKRTYFSGFYHQGEGSALTADIPSTVETMKALDAGKWMEHAPKENLSFDKPSRNVQLILKLIEAGRIAWSAEIVTAGRETSVKVNCWHRYEGEYITDLTNLDDALEELEEHLQDVADTLNHWFFKQLQKEYEYLTSDEAVKETIISNEYEFTVDGKKW